MSAAEFPPYGTELVEPRPVPKLKSVLQQAPLFVASIGGMALFYFARVEAAHLFRRGLDRDAWLTLAVGVTASSILVFGTPAVALWLVFRKRRQRLAAAVRVPGQVVNVRVKGIRGEDGYTETPIVRFTTTEGRSLQAASQLPTLIQKGLAPGDSVDVRYDPTDPGWVVVGEFDYGRFGLVLWLLAGVGVLFILGPLAWFLIEASSATNGESIARHAARPAHGSNSEHMSPWTIGAGILMFGGFGIVTAWDAIRKYRRHRARMARALEVSATITEIRQGVANKKKQQPVFQFRGFDGLEHTAVSAAVYEGKKETSKIAVGSSLRINYDPDDPTWAMATHVNLRRNWINAFGVPVFFSLFTLLFVSAIFWG